MGEAACWANGFGARKGWLAIARFGSMSMLCSLFASINFFLINLALVYSVSDVCTVKGSALLSFGTLKPFDPVVHSGFLDESDSDCMANEAKENPRSAGVGTPVRRATLKVIIAVVYRYWGWHFH